MKFTVNQLKDLERLKNFDPRTTRIIYGTENRLWIRHPDCIYGHVWIKHSSGKKGKLRKIRQKLIFTDGWECFIQ